MEIQQNENRKLKNDKDKEKKNRQIKIEDRRIIKVWKLGLQQSINDLVTYYYLLIDN